MIYAILFAKFTTIIFVCVMSLLLGIIIGIAIGRMNNESSVVERK